MKYTRIRRAAAAALIGAALLSGCGSTNTGDTVSVQPVSELTTRNISGNNRFSGVVEARSTQKIKKSSQKKVKKCYVSVGDTVKKGDLLFTYDTDSIELELQSAALELEELESNISSYDTQIAELEKEQKNATSSSDKLSYSLEIQSAKIDKAEAEYNLKSKQQSYETLQKSAQKTKVYSKISGVVQSINDGDSSDDDTSSSDAYITILQTSTYRVKATANEMNISTLEEGMEVTILSRLDEEETWSGTISSINTDGTSDTDTDNEDDYNYDDTTGETATQYTFYVKLDDSDGLLLGQHVYVSAEQTQSEEEANALQLAAAYLWQDEDGIFYVWVGNRRNRLEKRQVTVGDYNEYNDTYSILDGLTEEDYIAYPDDGLEEGMKVSQYQDTEEEADEDSAEYEEGEVPGMSGDEEVPVG
jgi:HlyD family secretion protein